MENCTTKKLVQKLNIIKESQPLTFAYSISHETPEQHKLHINRFYEIYILVQGDTDYIVEDSYFSLKPGDIIIINPYEVHKAVLKSSALYERFYFLVPENIFFPFSFDPMQQIISKSSSSKAAVTKSKKKNQKNLIRLSDENQKKVLNLLYEMLAAIEKDTSSNTQFAIYGQFIQFIALLSDTCHEEFSETYDHDTHLPRHIKEILTYINENLTKIESVEEIANNLGISLPHLSTIFKNAIGTPIIKYIQTRRIAYAKTLLDKGSSVTDACFESGFNDCAYFIKIFKQHTGITPLQYRKSEL